MRKIIFLEMALAIMLAVLAGCEKQSAEKVKMTFYAYPQGGERTGFDVDGRTTVWKYGDEIKIFSSADTEGSIFVYTSSDDSNYGVFEGELVKSSKYAAAYPANIASTTDGSTIIFNLPNSQNYVANTFASGTVPRVSYSTTNKLQFKNTTGLLRIGIKTTADVTVTKMKLTDKNSSVKLWGRFQVTATSSNGLEYVSDGDNTLTIALGDGVSLNATDYTYFFFCLPAGTLAGGFTLDMESLDGGRAKIDYTGNAIVTELNVGKPFDAEGVEFVTPISTLDEMADHDGEWKDPSSELSGITKQSGNW